MHISPKSRKYHHIFDAPKEITAYKKQKYLYIVRASSFESEESKYIPNDAAVINRDPSVFVASQKFSLPIELNQLNEEINRSKFILTLKDNEEWMGDGNEIISIELYEKAIGFLIIQCSYIFRQFGIIIQSPEINPCSNGTIDFSWRTKQSRLLINIKNTPKGYLAYYYGDYYNNESPTKGSVSIDKVSAFLAVWMRDLK